MKTVSIIIPLYNAHRYLERCMKSVMAQTYPHIEIIFVNDGSTDNSCELLDEYVKKYNGASFSIRIISHQENRGIAASRNTGISNATGDYIYMLDSDDYIEKDAIEIMVEKANEEDSDIVFGDLYLHTRELVEEIKQPRYENKQSFIRGMISPGFFHSVWNKLMKRSLFYEHDIKAVEGCNIGEDQIIMTQVSYYATHISYVDRYTYHYDCTNPNSISNNSLNSFKEKSAHQLMESASYIKSFFKDKEPSYYEMASQSQFHHFVFCLSNLCRSKQKEAYYNFLKRHNNIDKKYWTLNEWQKPIFSLIISNYHLMFLYLKRKKS